MAIQEKVLTCCECGKTFPFTVEEQEFFASKGFANEPKRCPACRQKRRFERRASVSTDSYGTRERQMYPVICAECGKETQVPFKPRGDRPVYCPECYLKHRNNAADQ